MCRAAAFLLGLSLAAASGASGQWLAAPAGGGGGVVAGGTVQAQVSVGDAIEGGGSGEDKGGYTGQLVDARALRLTAAPATIEEEGQRQIEAEAAYDDATLAASPLIAWSVGSGPLSGIDGTGLANAGAVFEETPAIVAANWRGITDTLELRVLETDHDNFGAYAGDGLDDGWQVAFFGLDNPAAAPGEDPDGDEQDNAFEYLAEVDPTDPLSVFCVDLTGFSSIAFSPVASGRVYTVLSSPTLSPADFTPLGAFSTTDVGMKRTILDTSTPATRRFYRVTISMTTP